MYKSEHTLYKSNSQLISNDLQLENLLTRLRVQHSKNKNFSIILYRCKVRSLNRSFPRISFFFGFSHFFFFFFIRASFITRDKICKRSRVRASKPRYNVENRKKKRREGKMIRFASRKWNAICRRFNCFISRPSFIYCGVIEIAVES